MKKNKFLVVLAVLTMGSTLLTSCDNTSLSSSFDSYESIDSIQILEPKEAFIVGQSINLNEYVKFLVNGEAVNVDYSVEVKTPSTVKLSGKTLEVIGEGTINVKIDCKGKSERFVAKSISSLKAKFATLTKEIGKTYYVDNLIISNDSMKLSGKGAIHNNYYFAVCNDSDFFGEDSLDNKWTGMLKTLSGYTYSFTMDDSEGTNLVVNSGKRLDLTNYMMSQDFPLKVDDFSTEDNYLVSYQSDTADEWINCSYGSLATPSELGATKSGVKIEFKNVLDKENKEIETLIVSTIVFDTTIENVKYTKENPYIYLQNAVLFDRNYFSVAGLNNYIDKRLSPTAISSTELQNGLTPFIESKTYSIDSSLYYANANGDKLSNHPNDFPVSEDKTYANPNGLSYVYGDGGISGIYKQNGNIYSVTNFDDNENILPNLSADLMYTNAETIDMWDAFDDLYITAISSTSIMKNLNILSKQTNGDVTKYNVGLISSETFFSNAISLIPGYGRSLNTYFSQSVGNTTLMSLIDCSITISSNEIFIDFSLLYSANIYYHMSHRIYAAGEDNLAPLFNGVTFPM